MTELIQLRHHVAGRATAAPAGFEQFNPADPADLRVVGPEADEALVSDAVAAARAAAPLLRGMGVEARSDALAAIGRALAQDADRLSVLIVRETGKVIGDARGEVVRAARLFNFFAGEPLRNVGERFESTRRGAMVEVSHEPLGLVGAITPWNFPIAIPAWKIAPALAYGNAVVWKPSELSSATAAALMDHIAGAGLPAGAVNMVLGGGSAGRLVSEAQGLDAISFTGSTATGARVRRIAAERSMRMQLEMGGVNGLLILADADLDTAVECAVNGAFFSAGQRCTATSRIIVEAAFADRFVEALRARTAGLVTGNPRDPATHVGPLVAPRQKQAVKGLVADVEAAGLTAVLGGSGVDLPHSFFAPTLFDHVPGASLLAREEIFGPVAGVFRVADFDEGLAVLNSTRFGLSAGLCTGSLKHAEAFKRHARAGMTMINLPTAGVDYHAPFGGVGDSSYGPREQGRAARDFYTSMKTNYQTAV